MGTARLHRLLICGVDASCRLRLARHWLPFVEEGQHIFRGEGERLLKLAALLAVEQLAGDPTLSRGCPTLRLRSGQAPSGFCLGGDFLVKQPAAARRVPRWPGVRPRQPPDRSWIERSSRSARWC